MRDQELQPIPVIDRQPYAIQAVRAEEGMTLGDILQSLLRHRWFIAACAAASVALSLLYLKLKPPLYEASAVVRIDPERADTLAISDRPATMPTEPGETLHTEIVLLKSDDVAIRTLNSLTGNEFEKFIGSRRGTSPIPQDVRNLSDQEESWILRLEKALTVKQIDGTQLINVSISYTDPKVAAAIANAVVRAYTVQTFENRSHSVAQLRSWLSTQMDELKNHFEMSQAKLTEFQEANDVVGTVGASNTIADRLHVLSERLLMAQSDRITKEAQLRAVSGGSPSELATLFPNPKLSSLQTAQGNLCAQYAQLSSKFGPNYPPLVDLAKQIHSMDLEIKQEVQSVLDRLNSDYSAAKNAQDMLQTEYDKQVALAFRFNRNQAAYTVLQDDMTASRELYEALRRKLQQATVDAEVGGLDMMLVQGARMPIEPAGPRKIFILLGSLIVGLFAGAVAALILDSASDHVRGGPQIERELSIPVLSEVSGLFKDVQIAEGRGGIAAGRVPMVLAAPSSRTTEAIRSVRNSIVLEERAKTVLVTSGHDEEGTLPVAVNLAVLLAQSGARVLIVDTDLQTPRGHDEFGIDNGSGLGEFLAGDTVVPQLVQPVPNLKNLLMVTAGHVSSNSSELISSSVLRSLLLHLKREFDHVILIGTPLLVTNAGVPLASWSDTTILIVKNGQSRLRELKTIRDTLLRNKARIHGVVISERSNRWGAKQKNARHQETRYVYQDLAKQAQGGD